ncbi:leucine-rich repeat domain-containing protein [Candidatus Saccharibacteria bacterium]|nr:leucine-rich repeat domain-containing protein [Candidatus Saccharibacteria bacterium]
MSQIAVSLHSFKIFVATLAIVGSFLLLAPGLANAAMPPDSCFAFSSNTITDYYDYEGNDSNNSACTRDVDIPASIGGSAVTAIGNGAFNDNSLTTLTIPNTVSTIGENAFSTNKLATVIIPNSVVALGRNSFSINDLTALTISNQITAIDSTTFAANKLVLVTLPSSVLSIDNTAFIAQSNRGASAYYDLFSGDSARSASAMDDIFFIRLYTEDPVNPTGLVDDFTVEAEFGSDFNGDGDQDDSFGGHIINPVASNVSYKDTAGNTLQPDLFQTGNGGLTDYMVKNNPNNELNRYFRFGNEQTFTPPAISGFTTPANATFALNTVPTTNYSFIYQSTAQPAGASGVGGNNSNNLVSTLAETGDNASILGAVSIVMILSSAIAVKFKHRILAAR